MEHAVAIIGMGARFPGAPDLAAYRRLIREGRVAHEPVPADRWDHARVWSANPRHANRTPAKQGAFMAGIADFSPEFFGITPKRARIMDPQQRLVLEISRQALEDAGYARRRLAAGRVGVYVGASSSDHRTLVAGAVNVPCDLTGRSGIAPGLSAAEIAAVTAALPPIQGYSIVGQQLNMIAANVSQAFDFDGPAFALDTACSSALAALHEAVWHLRAGLVDAALVGGVYVQLDPIMMVCFSRIGALSASDACRPFQAGADGFVLGEGVGMIVVKRLADALAAGDRVLAVIRGIAMNNDGRGGGPLTPRAAGQVAAMTRAWADAGVSPATAGLLEAHGTATPAGDRIELEAMTAVFGSERTGAVALGAAKANIGHGLASAGIASLIKAVGAVHDGVVPPLPGADARREEWAGSAAWLRWPTAPERWAGPPDEPRRAGVSAFGFGGTNVHVVLEAVPRAAATVRAAAPVALRFEVSAPDAARLAEYLAALETTVREEAPALADVAFTLAKRRADPVAVAWTATDAAEFFEKIAARRAALLAGTVPAGEAGGSAEGGGWVSLPPSPLAERRFWLIDETKRRAAGAADEAVSVAADEPEENGAGGSPVAAAVAAVTAWRAEDVRPERRFVGDLGFDSLTTLEFMTVLGRSLPGVPPPPRTLFTPELTVGQLEEFLAAARPAAAGTVARFDGARHPWIEAHTPGGRNLLPMAALMQAALTAARARDGAGAGLAEFRVQAPAEIVAGRAELRAEVGTGDAILLRAATDGAVFATGAGRPARPAEGRLAAEEMAPGELSLAEFYAEFGFHGEALRSLVAVPTVGATTALGKIRGGADEVPILDGALQLALYWLAVRRRRTAVATGFADFRALAPWPTTGEIECRATMTGEDAGAVRGDFDFLDAAGNLVAQWRGVEARVAGATGIESWPEVRRLAERKAGVAAAGLKLPFFESHDGRGGAVTTVGGRELLNFASYDYLGLAGHAAVAAAATAAVARYGTSASASRLASGERPIHGELERAIAEFLGCEAALALVSGHATNVAVIGHLLGPEDLVLHDSLAHDCIVSGARLSGARRLVFPHNDLAALERLLVRERPKARRALVAVEGVYSMDGDLAPLPGVAALKRRHDALLLVDEAHSLGVLGATGRGAGEHFAVARGDVDLWMGTMSKTLASCGGYLAGARTLIDYLRFTLPGFVYSVGLSPANAAAARAALGVLAAEPERVSRLRARAEFFRTLCRERGVDIGASADAAVVPAITGGSERALRVAEALGGRGINVQPIFFPAVEEGKARLRFFVTAEHTEAQLRRAADALAEELPT